MADQLQLRGGTTAENDAFTGAQREISIDTDKNTVVVHDGFTSGGYPLANSTDVTDTTIYFDDDTGAGSAADAYVLTPKTNTRTPTQYEDGLALGFVTVNTNTGASTANFSNIGVKNIKLADGSDPDAGSIDGRVNLIYDSANDWFELQVSNLDPSEKVELKSGRINLLRGNFRVNQRGVSGSVSLTAGEFGHDRFRGGSGGCNYTFATLSGVTTITITSGTLEQVVSSDDILGGTHVLSWTGTSQAQINSGGYGDSGQVSENLVGGSDATVEFNTGTLSEPQLERGSFATDFEKRPLTEELLLCGAIDDGDTTFGHYSDGTFTSRVHCAAWVNFNGVGTVAIRDSYNVSSITDLGTGLYQINFERTLANANYSIWGQNGGATGSPRTTSIEGTPLDSSFDLYTRNSSLNPEDHEVVCAGVFAVND